MIFSQQNPIIQAELTRASRRTVAQQALGVWLMRAMWAAALGLCVFFVGFTIWNYQNARCAYTAFGIQCTEPAFPLTTLYQHWEAVQALATLLAAFATLTHFRLLFRTLALTAHATQRERLPSHWETLLMTGVSPRSFVVGKWGASLRLLWHEWLLLAFLRAAAVLAISPFISTLIYSNPHDVIQQMPPAVAVGLAALSVISMTLLNGIFTAACGILGGLVQRYNGSALTGGLLVRLAALFLPIFIGAMIFFAFSGIDGQVIAIAIGSLAENSIFIPALLAYPHEFTMPVFAILAFDAAFYAIAAAVLLVLAVRLARARGMVGS